MTFFELEKMQVGSKLEQSVISQASEILDKQGEKIYYFDSDDYSYPHSIVSDTNNIILDISLYIPKSDRQRYRDQYSQMGQPDHSITDYEYETRNYFLESNQLFIFDEIDNSIQMVVKTTHDRILSFISMRTEQSTLENNRANSTATDQIFEKTTTESALVEPGQLFGLSSMQVFGGVGLILLLVFLLSFLYWKNYVSKKVITSGFTESGPLV